MTFECEICGKSLSSKKYSTSKGHIKSKRHQDALKSIKKDITATHIQPIKETSENKYFADLILFNAVKSYKKPNYLNILDFCASFNLKTDVIITRLQNRIRIGDIKYSNINDENIQNIIHDILNKPKIQYPLIIPIQDFLQEFPSLYFNNFDSIVKFLQNIIQRYPEYLRLSSSKLGYPADLVTFNHLFPNFVFFSLSNRWRVEQ
jgi:hypothetical protein